MKKVLLCGNSQMATRSVDRDGSIVSYELLIKDFLERSGAKVVSSLNSGKLMRSIAEFPNFEGFDVVVLAFGHNELAPRPLSNSQIEWLEKSPVLVQFVVRKFVHYLRVPILRVRHLLGAQVFKISMSEFESDIDLVLSKCIAKLVFIEVPMIPSSQDLSINYGINSVISEFNDRLSKKSCNKLSILSINSALKELGDHAFLSQEVHFTADGHRAIFLLLKERLGVFL